MELKCKSCLKVLPVTSFKKKDFKSQKTLSGFSTECKSCVNDKFIAKNGFMRKCHSCGIEAHTIDSLELFCGGQTYPFERQNWCKKCRSEYEDGKDRNRRLSKVSSKFGISEEDFYLMLSNQNGKCAICNKTAEEVGGRTFRLSIDHCHTTGKVRGLLCSSCNLGIGKFKDNIKLLNNAIKYLERKD